ncbi:hypothetical protein [Microbacterium pygmaeum]|uniref:Uncharacterized protein n=1 Tax=Microbacterium pygmaeum TaxID=370764 RepID=A0A1G8A1M6_9MICO|nr:hypothetical protein [Microbacterium pygmaeum]SDH14737.1 hypothetical protein SAMN04489810_2237 [Microbacterium pygmaeum]
MSNTDHSIPSDDNSLEGPDIEVPTEGADDNATVKGAGLGQDGTIPAAPDGIAAGHTGEPSNFEPEEDEDAG